MEETITYHTCSKCNEKKPLTEKFFRKQNNSRGFRANCRDCGRKYSREVQKKKREENPNYAKENNRRFRENNPEYNANYLKVWRKENPEKVKKHSETYKKNNPDYRKDYVSRNKKLIRKISQKSHNKRFKNDEVYRLKIRTRDLIGKSFISNRTKKDSKTFDILGCDINFFKTYLEEKFDDRMNWDNHGQFGWHLDHIIPVSSAKTKEEVIKLNHYTNFQPLWWEDNLKKSNIISEEYCNLTC